MSMKQRRMPLLVAIVMVMAVAVVCMPGSARGAGNRLKVIAKNLDNPRGLAVTSNGDVYVAEAGRGGKQCFKVTDDGETETFCYGTTGAITRIHDGSKSRVGQDLPSLADPEGTEAIGPTDISIRANTKLLAIIGNESAIDPSVFDTSAAGFGKLYRLSSDRSHWRTAGDVSAYERANNPDKGEIDTNPYAVQAVSNRGIVADAAANALLSVANNGKVSLLAVFPNRIVTNPQPPPARIPMQAVPEAVTQGPDGAYYVGQLTGYPFPKGAARVYRVDPKHIDTSKQPPIYASGFTNIIDLAFGPDHKLYVLEIAKDGLLADTTGSGTAGALIRVNADGSKTTIASDGLVSPTGLAFGPKGEIYVSNYGTFADKGQVVQVLTDD